jgi:ribonuclease inhibitor
MPRQNLIEIDLRDITTSKDLQLLLMDALDFPGWYGCNWNAFWDAITGLVEMPEILRLVGWASLEARLPSDARLMRECLSDMSEKHPELSPLVVYA